MAAPTPIEQMQALGGGGAGGAFSIPKLPQVPIPERVSKAYPELAEWWRKQSAEMEKWRQDVTAVFTGRSI